MQIIGFPEENQSKVTKNKSKNIYLKFKDLKLHIKRAYNVPENINPECPERHLLE